MRVLTVPELHEWVRVHSPDCYVFSAENNMQLVLSGLHIKERFYDLIYSASTDRLCFRNSTGTLCLEHVKEVHMFDDIESIGIVFDIVCNVGHNLYTWRLIAD